MKISITGRHGELADDLREYAAQKVGKLEKYFGRIQWIKVILDGHTEPRSAEIVIGVVRGSTLVAEASAADLHAAVDLLIDKAEHQLTRFKDKLQDKRGR
ncbi:MAG: ribosome-associated translation inhibitor RaiA [Planctomycetota bacterium]